jgi:hypothetical protein
MVLLALASDCQTFPDELLSQSLGLSNLDWPWSSFSVIFILAIRTLADNVLGLHWVVFLELLEFGKKSAIGRLAILLFVLLPIVVLWEARLPLFAVLLIVSLVYSVLWGFLFRLLFVVVVILSERGIACTLCRRPSSLATNNRSSLASLCILSTAR